MKPIDRLILITLILLGVLFYRGEQLSKGQANADIIARLHNLEVDPAAARWFLVTITTTDVQVSLEQLTVLP